MCAEKRRIIVYNKTDLADPSMNERLRNLDRSLDINQKSFLLSQKKPKDYRNLLEVIKQMSNRITFEKHQLGEFRADESIRMLVVGVPNVGKSTIINRLRVIGKGSPRGTLGTKTAVPTGAYPGVTRLISNLVRIIPGGDLIRMHDNPTKYRNITSTNLTNSELVSETEIGDLSAETANICTTIEQSFSTDNISLADRGGDPTHNYIKSLPIYVYDTPGVLIPKIKDSHQGLKLAITGAIMDKVVNEHLLVEFLLHCLNNHSKQSPPTYVEYYKIGERHLNENLHCTDVLAWIDEAAGITKSIGKDGKVNETNTIAQILKAFRLGELGRFTLDNLE